MWFATARSSERRRDGLSSEVRAGDNVKSASENGVFADRFESYAVHLYKTGE